MKKKILVTALVICLILSNITLAAANSGVWNTIDVLVNGITVMVNGQTIEAENLLYNGTTYVPIRAVSEALGANVIYVGDSKTAIITLNNKNTDSNASANANTNASVDTETSLPADVFPLHLYSYDSKEYLGKLVTDKYDSDSIWNEYGTYGSKYQTNSIWNEYGDYGGKYSNTSAFNEYATEPPKVIDNKGNFVGYLTTNEYMDSGYAIEIYMMLLRDNNQ